MMRLGVVTTSYPRFPGDLAGNFVGAHVAALRALGHDVEVIAAGDGPDRISSPLFYGAGAPDELERGGRLLAAASFSARLAFAVARRARHWDAAIAHWLAPSALASLPARRLLAIAHGGDIHALRRAHLLAPALHALRARRARLAFVSQDLLDLARSAAPSPWLDSSSIVQPMGISPRSFSPLLPFGRPKGSKGENERGYVLVVSRLVPIKGVDVAIRAARELGVELVIAGDGPERGRLEAMGRARFVGIVTPEERERLFARAACVVVPSRVLPNGRTEGTPMIALEALAAGVPVIASAVGGLRALAPPARLVPPDDPQALAKAIAETIAAPPDPEILRARVADLDWPRVARRLLEHLSK